MTDFMTRLALVGAAVSFAAWVFLVNKQRIARVPDFISRIPRSSLSVFLAFAIVATSVAQKGGTNAPPNGASPPQMLPPSGGNVELRMENVELRNLSPLIENEQFHNSPFYILHSQLSPQFPFRLESVATNDSYSYAMPTNGTRYARWWKRGGYA